MSGTVIRIIEDTHYDFLSLAALGEQDLIVAQRIDVSQYRTASLLVRIVKLQLGNNNDSVNIAVTVDPWDPFQGTTVFFPPTATVPLPATSLNSSGEGSAPPSDPYAMLFSLNTPFGALLAVDLVAKRNGGVAGTDALNIQLNADLVLKD